MKLFYKTAMIICLSCIMMFGNCLGVFAEETNPAGYHIYDVQENEVSDTWYSVAKGAYLHSGIARLKEGDSAGYAVCSGHTFAHMDCDRLYVRIYLDQSDNGTDGWGNVNYWTGEAFNTSFVSASSGSYKVDRYNYYSVQGAHSVTEGELTESTNTGTNAIYFN